ncbi:MAG: TraB/GumN family protein [Sphingomicrobium sp.]
MKFLRLAAAAAAVLTPALPATAVTLPDADPAMWVVKDKDTTVYLFGTFHVLDGKSDWFNDEVKQAFDRSDEIVMEAIIPEDPTTLAPMMAKYALSASGKPLTERLSPEARAKLVKVLGASGIPAAALDKMKPGFAGMTIALIPYQQAGMTAEHGTEKTLATAAKSANKPVGELEGIENQLKMLEKIPESAHLRSLEEVLAKFEELPAIITDMKTNWNAGNADGFAKLMNEMQANSPEMFKVMLTDRNSNWAEWIDQRMDKPGTVFVAVGTAHLAGKDSVQEFLTRRGINSSRVPAS